MKTIAEILTEQGIEGDAAAALSTALMEREDEMAMLLGVNGANFGLFPEIVAEVLAELGLGTPPDETTRAFIHSQFHARMQALRQEFERRTGQAPPPEDNPDITGTN